MCDLIVINRELTHDNCAINCDYMFLIDWQPYIYMYVCMYVCVCVYIYTVVRKVFRPP